MKKLILALLRSELGKAILRVLLDHFLKALQKKGYYMAASAADSSRNGYGNILEKEMFRSAMISEFVDTELENVKP
jgi:hypothetical protein